MNRHPHIIPKALLAVCFAAGLSLWALDAPAPARRTEYGDPIGNYNFKVTIDGVDAGQFTAVDGLSVEQEVVGSEPWKTKDNKPSKSKRAKSSPQIGMYAKTVPTRVASWWSKTKGRKASSKTIRIRIYQPGSNGKLLCTWGLDRAKLASVRKSTNKNATYRQLIAVEGKRIKHNCKSLFNKIVKSRKRSKKR